MAIGLISKIRANQLLDATINGVQLYFDGSGKQIKGKRILIDGKYYYFAKNNGELLRNAFYPYNYYSKLYFGNDGAQVFGWYTLDNHPCLL